MFNYRKNLFISFSTLVILLSVTGIITFIIDPLQHYRKAIFYQPYPLEQRYLIWGMIDNYDYDSILIGTSMSENFMKSNIDTKLNINVLNAAISGATAYEQNLMISRAIKHDVKKVILILDVFSFKGDIEESHSNKTPFYITNDTYFDDYKYLLNIDIIFKNTMKIFLTNYLGIQKNLLDINRFWNWNNANTFSKQLCLKDFNTFIDTNNAYYADKFYIDSLIKSFNFNILPHIKNNDIEYIVVFPPYSILTYKLFEHYKKFKDFILFKKYIIDSMSSYTNVKIYDFQIAKEITHNLDNYKDISHYSEDINKWMIQQIKDDNYLLTNDNINAYLQSFKIQIKNYKPSYLKN